MLVAFPSVDGLMFQKNMLRTTEEFPSNLPELEMRRQVDRCRMCPVQRECPTRMATRWPHAVTLLYRPSQHAFAEQGFARGRHLHEKQFDLVPRSEDYMLFVRRAVHESDSSCPRLIQGTIAGRLVGLIMCRSVFPVNGWARASAKISIYCRWTLDIL